MPSEVLWDEWLNCGRTGLGSVPIQKAEVKLLKEPQIGRPTLLALGYHAGNLPGEIRLARA